MNRIYFDHVQKICSYCIGNRFPIVLLAVFHRHLLTAIHSSIPVHYCIMSFVVQENKIGELEYPTCLISYCASLFSQNRTRGLYWSHACPSVGQFLVRSMFLYTYTFRGSPRRHAESILVEGHTCPVHISIHLHVVSEVHLNDLQNPFSWKVTLGG